MPGFGILALCGYGALRRGATGGSLRWALAAQKRCQRKRDEKEKIVFLAIENPHFYDGRAPSCRKRRVRRKQGGGCLFHRMPRPGKLYPFGK